MYNVV